MKRFVAWALIASAFSGFLGIIFSYDTNLSDSFFTLAGFGLYVFGIWSAIILLRQKR